MKSTHATPRLLHCNCTLLLLLLLRPVIVAASYGTCTGNNLACVTVDKEACKSANDNFYNGDKCRWFDYTGLVIGLAVMGALSIVLGALLFMVWERMSSLETKLKDAGLLGTELKDTCLNGEGIDSVESPLLATMTYNEKIAAKKKQTQGEERNAV